MSYSAEKWARQQKTGNARAKAVLLELANCYNGETGKCCPSLDHLCEITELDRHTVINAIKYLVEKSFVEKALIKTSKGRGVQYSLLGFEDSAKTYTTDSVKTNTIPDKHSVEINTTHSVKNDTTHSVEINTRTSNKNKEIEQVNKKEVEEKESDDFLLTPVEKPTKRSSLKKPENITEQTWKDFNAIRKAKKAPLTETALNRIQSEATKAGIDLETALQVCCERGWQGFKADWYARDNTAKTPSPIRQTQPHELTSEDFTDKQISFFAYKLSRFQPFCSAYGEGFQTYDAFATKIETWLRHPERFKKCLPYLKRLNLVN